jgi:hypothetical protein
MKIATGALRLLMRVEELVLQKMGTVLHLLSQHLSGELKVNPTGTRDNSSMHKASLLAVVFIALSVGAGDCSNYFLLCRCPIMD